MATVRAYLAAAGLLGLSACGTASMARAESITVVSWGGSYEKAQQEAVFKPFTERTGIEVNVATYNGGLQELRQQHQRGQPSWDVVDMLMSDTLAACKEGLLKPLSFDELPPAPDGTPPARDFMQDAFTRCGIAHTVYATVIAYNRNAFPGVRPTKVADLFDTEQFPGKRALQKAPFGNLEWALRSYDVPRKDIYNLLSTKRGLRLALQRLASIADSIIWWREGSKPPELLANGKAVMATGYNGRFFNAMAANGAPIEILWDGQIQELENWVIAKGTDQPEAAKKFLRYATSTQTLARFARYIPYGPTRQSASRRVSTYINGDMDMQPHLPTFPYNDRNAIVKDVAWYASTYDRIRQVFQNWLDNVFHKRGDAKSSTRTANQVTDNQ